MYRFNLPSVSQHLHFCISARPAVALLLQLTPVLKGAETCEWEPASILTFILLNKI